MPSSFVRFRSTRRTATVTTSAPDASIARIMSAFEAYLPVPTIRREWNSFPPMMRGATSRAFSIATPISAATDKVDDLQYIALVQVERSIGIPISQDCPVVLYHYEAGVDSERAQEARDGTAGLKLPRGSVHHQGDHFARCRSMN